MPTLLSHAVGVLDPGLQQAGYGSCREADGDWQMGATLDVIRELGPIPSPQAFPIRHLGDKPHSYRQIRNVPSNI
jgi:hypothetical protein